MSAPDSDDAAKSQEAMPDAPTTAAGKKKVVRRKVVKRVPATPSTGPSEDEQARILMEEIARVEAEILRKQQLEKEIKEMEAMIAAAEAAASKEPAPKPKRKVIKRRVTKAPAPTSTAAVQATVDSGFQGSTAEPSPLPVAPVSFAPPEEPAGPIPAWAAKRQAQDQPWNPPPLSLDASSRHSAPAPPVAPSIPDSPHIAPTPAEPLVTENSMPAWAAKKRGFVPYAPPLVTEPPPETYSPGAEHAVERVDLESQVQAQSQLDRDDTYNEPNSSLHTEQNAHRTTEPQQKVLHERHPQPLASHVSHEEPVPAWAAKRRETSAPSSELFHAPVAETETAYAESITTQLQGSEMPHQETAATPTQQHQDGSVPAWAANRADPNHQTPSELAQTPSSESYVANEQPLEPALEQDVTVPAWAARRSNNTNPASSQPVLIQKEDQSPTPISSVINDKPVHPLAAAFALGGGSAMAPEATVVESQATPSQPQETKETNKSVVSADKGPPMREDPRFVKYWKMKMVKLPDGAILNAMVRDGVDESVLSMDWERNYEAQLGSPNSTPSSGGIDQQEVAQEGVQEAYDEEYYDENLGYYDEEGYWHWYENEGYYDEEGNWIWYPYEDEIVEEQVVQESAPEPVSRGDLLSSIAFAAQKREKRLEETGGELIMQEHEPEVDAKKSGPPQLSFSLTEMVTKKAREREARLEAGGEKKMTKIKEKEEYKKDFNTIALEAAALGRLTRLNEHTIEAVAQEKTPEEEWKSQGLLAIQWRSNHMAVIFEAARAGAAFKLPEKVVSNFPELEEDWDYEDEEYLTPRMQQLLDLTNEVGTGQHKVDKLVLGIKEENAGAESLAIKPMVFYQNIEDVKLPRPAPPKIDIEKHKKKLDEKARISKRPLSNISDYVAEKAWERRTRLDRPGALPRMKTFCECPYCINPSPYQTFAYKEKARHAKTEAEMKEEAEKERQKLREERRKRRDAVMAKRLEEAEKELQERNKQKSYASSSAECRPARTPRTRPPRVRPSPSNEKVEATTEKTAPVAASAPSTVAPGKPTAESRRALRQARKANRADEPTNATAASAASQSTVPSNSGTRRPIRTGRQIAVAASSTTAIAPSPSQAQKTQPIQRVPAAPQPSKIAGPPATTARPARPARQPVKPAAAPSQAGTTVTTTVVKKGKNGAMTKTTVVRKGPPPKPGAATPARPAPAAAPQKKGLFGGMLSGGKTTVKTRVVRK